MAKMQYPNDIVCITSPFGAARDLVLTNGQRLKDVHNGIDLTGRDHKGGEPILAPHNGYVIWAGLSQYDKAYGIFTEHWGVDGVPKGHHVVCWYWHLYSITKGIEPGVRVSQGQMLGKEGRTGNVTGDHLHFSMAIVPDTLKYSKNNISTGMFKPYLVDPMDWLHLYPHQEIRSIGKDWEKRIKKVERPSKPTPPPKKTTKQIISPAAKKFGLQKVEIK